MLLILRTKGLINTVLMGAGLIDQPLDLLYSELAVMIGLVYGELPFMILPHVSRWRSSTSRCWRRPATWARITSTPSAASRCP